MKKITFWILIYVLLISSGLYLIKPIIYQEEICGIIQEKMQPTVYNNDFMFRNRIVMSIKNSIILKCNDGSIETINNVDDKIYYSKEVSETLCIKRVNGNKYLIYIGIFCLLIISTITLFFVVSLILVLYQEYIK